MGPAEAFVLEALKQRMTQVADDPGVDDAKKVAEFVVRSMATLRTTS